MITDKIKLPPLLLLRSKSYITNLYIKQNLSKCEIGRKLNVNHSTVISALRKFGIEKEQSKQDEKLRGQLPFGFDYIDGRLMKNRQEHEAIRMMKQLKANGASLRMIAGELNKRLIPTKNNGIWQANTIKKILSRTG